MTILERFKLELSNKEYYTDTEYIVFLSENSLTSTQEYDKSTMQRQLLLSVIDVFETLANDIDLMRKIDVTDISSTTQAIEWIRTRIDDVKTKIATIEVEGQEEYTNLHMLFTNYR